MGQSKPVMTGYSNFMPLVSLREAQKEILMEYRNVLTGKKQSDFELEYKLKVSFFF